MKKTILAAVYASLLLGGCATSRTFTGQDGKPVHKISCDGMAQDVSACYEKAGEICSTAGYTILNQDGSAAPMAFVGGGSFSMVTAVKRTVVVRCNG